jgi:hypothetical protein
MGDSELATEIYAGALDAVDIDANSKAVAQLNLLIQSDAKVTELYRTH